MVPGITACAEGSQVKRRVQNGAIARASISEPCSGYIRICPCACRLEELGHAGSPVDFAPVGFACSENI